MFKRRKMNSENTYRGCGQGPHLDQEWGCCAWRLVRRPFLEGMIAARLGAEVNAIVRMKRVAVVENRLSE